MPKVIVIGGANVDIKGRSSGSYIEATSNPGEVTMSVGGVGRNIAENLARLGVETALVTVLGDDSNGRLVREACAAAGVDLSLAITGPSATGTYLAVLDDRGELVSAVNDMRSIEWLDVPHLEAMAADLGRAAMLVADCNISTPCLQWLCRFSAERGVRLLIEPVSVPKARKLLAFERQTPVHAITPNRQQASALTGEAEDEMSLARLHALGFANVVMHCGATGALASTGGSVELAKPFPAVTIADVTGAGDAAVAGLVSGLLEGLTLAEAARLGQAAAAIKLSSRDSVSSRMSRDRVRQLSGL